MATAINFNHTTQAIDVGTNTVLSLAPSGVVKIRTSAGAPVAALTAGAGAMYFDTAAGTLQVSDGATWTSTSGTGADNWVIAFALNS